MIIMPSHQIDSSAQAMDDLSAVGNTDHIQKKIGFDQRGFTLIELMITLVIIAILAAIAIPSYRSQIQRNAEEKAKSTMLSVADQLAMWRSKRLSYAGFKPINEGCTPACFSNDPTNTILYLPLGSTSSNYRYQLTIVNQSGVTLTPPSSTIGTTTNATGRGWRILAEPNPNDSVVNDADRYYLDNSGQRCVYTYGTTLPTLTATTINCANGGAGISQW